MKVTGARSLLLAGTGLALIMTTPVAAQQQDCMQRLDDIEQQITQAEMASENRSDVEEVIEGARSLAESGDQEGCMNVVAELEDVVATLEQTGSLQTDQQAAQPAQEQQAQPEQQAAGTEQQVQPEQEAAGTEQQQPQPQEQAARNEMQAGTESQPQEQAAATEQQPQEQAAETEMQAGTEAQPQEQAAGTEMQAGTEAQPGEQAAGTEMQAGTEAQPQEQAAETEMQEAQPEQQAAETEAEETQPEESPLAAMPASELIGTEVVNDQGESIAEIIDLVRDSGDQMHAVLSVGGFLGIGAREVTVALGEFELGQEDEVVLAGMTEDALQEMPEYDEAQYQPVEQE